MSFEVFLYRHDNADIKPRIRVAQIIEHTIRLLEALAARRRNNLPANPLPAQIHPAPSINAPQHQNVPTGGPQPTSLSSGVAQPTQPGNSPYVGIPSRTKHNRTLTILAGLRTQLHLPPVSAIMEQKPGYIQRMKGRFDRGGGS